ncbi:MAG: YibE/F family protein [Erysipelotrichaceae bacterium]
MKRKQTILIIITCIIASALIYIGHLKYPYIKVAANYKILPATVVNIISKDNTTHLKTVLFEAKLPDNSSVLAIQTIDDTMSAPPQQVQLNNKIFITNYDDINSQYYNFIEYNRSSYTIIIFAIFGLLIILIGRKKGLYTVLSLVFTAGIIFYYMLPAILNGANIYLVSTLTSIYIILVTLILLNGLNKKTLCAIIGNSAGVTLAGLLTVWFSNLYKLTGLVKTDYTYLLQLESGVKIDLLGIVFAAVIIGSVGAIMDIAMSLSSAMHEISEASNNTITQSNLFKAGLNIGRDIIGTMTNTLILAYIGSSLGQILLLLAYQSNFFFIINSEMIVVDILQAIIGSLGILLCVPLTITICSIVYSKRRA